MDHEFISSGRTANQKTDWKAVLQSHFGTADLTPYVRYGTRDVMQLPTLTSISLPRPQDAMTVSPVYFLTDAQRVRHNQLDDPYAVSGSSSIAKEIQDDCEDDGRVLYPIHVESDSLSEVSNVDAMIPTIRRFVSDRLNIQVERCTWWYSGSRSIHVHTPLFVTDTEREGLQEIAKQFNASEGSDVKLDAGIYDRKRQFRLPGVKHQSTGLLKVQIDTNWSHDRIIQEAATADREPPQSYTQFLKEVIPTSTTLPSPLQYVAREGSRSAVSAKYEIQSEDEYINGVWRSSVKEGTRSPGDSTERRIFQAHNAKEFSPYANTGEGNGRSVAVAQVHSAPFCCPKYGRHARLPCYFYYAVGGDGQFVKSQTCAPLLLSEHDYTKVEGIDIGENLIVIGGRSRRSKILDVDTGDAVVSAKYLEDRGRQVALRYLQSRGYEVGKSGLCGGHSQTSSSGESKASSLQEKAERRSIDALSHRERLHVANRLLQRDGWDGAWDWHRDQFGERFDPVTTHRNLRSVVEKYDDLRHIKVPPEPSAKK